MEWLTGLDDFPAFLRGGVIALGNFDGFHRGHQAVAGRAAARAQAEGRPFVIATFDPHPVRYFRPDTPPFRLTTLDQRAHLFSEAGANAMLVFAFDKVLAAQSAEAFVANLAARTGAAAVVTGQDFTFGRGREGNVALLRTLGARHGIAMEAVAPVGDGQGPVSSSRIRALLQEGRCEEAADLLSRPFAIAGPVIHGDKLGRDLGYPTANIDLGDYLRCAYGIYAVRGTLPDRRVLGGAANLGIRPSFEPPKELLEPYFFDFSGDLYGQRVSVELISYIRPEARFESLETLKLQMAADCTEARRRLSLSSH